MNAQGQLVLNTYSTKIWEALAVASSEHEQKLKVV